MQELDLFAAEATRVSATIALVESWDAPALGEWTVAELVAHLVRAVDRIDAYLDIDVSADAAAFDRVGYFRFDLAAAAPGVAERARQDAARLGTDELPRLFDASWVHTRVRCEDEGPARLIQTPRGPMRLDEYAATRVLELVVHHLDLRRALGLPPDPDPGALALTIALLEGLAGAPADADDPVRWVLQATGREPPDDPALPVIT